MTPPLIRRQQAAQATLDAFTKRPFALGRNDCARLVLFHLRKLGHPIAGLKYGSYKTIAQAKREMKKLGVKTLGELASRHFDEITPAAAMIGDIVELAGQRGMTGLGVVLGNGAIVAYHEDVPDGCAAALRTIDIIGAWRVPVS